MHTKYVLTVQAVPVKSPQRAKGLNIFGYNGQEVVLLTIIQCPLL